MKSNFDFLLIKLFFFILRYVIIVNRCVGWLRRFCLCHLPPYLTKADSSPAWSGILTGVHCVAGRVVTGKCRAGNLCLTENGRRMMEVKGQSRTLYNTLKACSMRWTYHHGPIHNRFVWCKKMDVAIKDRQRKT